MKKTSTIEKVTKAYEITNVINHTAYVRSMTGKTGLLNMNDNKLIGNLDYFDTICDKDRQYYIQKKQIIIEEKYRTDYEYTVNIYDAEDEKFIIDGWKLYTSGNHLYVVESPIDKKLHIFDNKIYREPGNIFNIGLDNVEKLVDYPDKLFLIITVNGKKGIYYVGQGLITPLEFDEIKKEQNITVFSKDEGKYFVSDKENKEDKVASDIFEEISIDKNNKSIVYCKKDGIIYIYNTSIKKLLLEVKCDSVEYVKEHLDSSYLDLAKYFFITRNDNKFGCAIILVEKEKGEYKVKKTSVLDANYDEVIDEGTFYLKKDDKIGLFSNYGTLIEPEYDAISWLGNYLYAFFKGEYCDISKIGSSLCPLVSKCKIIQVQREGIIFEKNNYFGMVATYLPRDFKDKYMILENYDSVRYLGKGYFELEKNGKKGIFYYGENIIPLEYDDIDIKCIENNSDKTIYFSLGKEDEGYKLIKKQPYYFSYNYIPNIGNSTFNKIEFLNDIMILKDETYSYIYDYNEKLLKTLPADCQISMLVEPDSHNKKTLYIVDGGYYFYKKGKFERTLVEECDLYITTYESECETVVISSYDKNNYDELCREIESNGEQNIDETISLFYKNNPLYRNQSRYPTFVKKLSLPK